MFKFNKKGQNTAEYAILIALVVAAAVAMQTYVKRGMQGGIKFGVDKLKKADGRTGQYEPYYLESSYDVTQSAYKDTEETKEGGEVIRIFGAGKGKEHVTTRTGYQKQKDITAFDRDK
jgi:hypothetical protein